MTQNHPLPKGWYLAPLSSVGKWGSGGTPTRTNQKYYDNGTIPWLVIGDLNEGYIKTATTFITEDGLENSSAKLLQKGTLLVAMYGSIGKTGITALPCATNQAIAHCTPNEGINLHYLHRAIQNIKPHLISLGKGGTQQNISQTILKDQKIPLPPINEQRRIADKLDRVLARVDAANEHLSRVAPLIKRFRQSVLEAAISGRLTEDWRGAHNIGKNWLETSLGAVITEMRNGISNKPDENPLGYKILRISAVRPLLLDTSDHRIISLDKETISLYSLQKGDILFTRYNGSLEFVGACAVFLEDQETFVYPDKLIRVRTDETKVLPQFLALTCSSKPSRKQIEGFIKSSAGQKGVSGKDLKTVKLALPSIAEQSEIVRRVEKLFAFADRLEERLSQAQEAVQKLTPALLAKAFRGELVPQDPNDEPASELLKRLQENRSESTKPSRARKPRARKSP